MTSHKPQILLIDDEPDILELLSEEFEYAGYDTYTASCGNDAVKILNDRTFDVVLSDYKMPHGDGNAVLEKVNKMEARPHFFFISGHVDMAPEVAQQKGVIELFSKPFDLESIIERINEELKRS